MKMNLAGTDWKRFCKGCGVAFAWMAGWMAALAAIGGGAFCPAQAPGLAPVLARTQARTQARTRLASGNSAISAVEARMRVDRAGVIGRSDIVLGQPNREATEALPLGNGRLGVAIWSADGLTAQLNRADTMPYRYSTGQLVIPGLARLTAAPDYSARLNLYAGTFEESGGGVRVRAYVQPKSDLLIVEVSGADAHTPQKALLRLWAPRKPEATITGGTGMLAESWLDNRNPGGSGERFGSLAAITAMGRNVHAELVDGRTIAVTVTPEADGRFRILVASPGFAGGANRQALVAGALRDRSPLAHEDAWREFWRRADTVKITSPDGAGEYMENLRAIYLYSAEAESGGRYPGSQAGVGDLFSSVRDEHQWDPSAFWHWNLRMQVAANLAAGLPELNLPYFRLYRENLGRIEDWTRAHMGGASGVCIPETMRFDGKGIEFETWGGNRKVSGWNCDLASGPYYNARTISTGAEVSLWIWRQYQGTGNRSFLEENFPVMAESARFLLGYEKPGEDGLRHTSPSNAHETQWDVRDPVTDLAARQALFQATVAAATLLGRERAMVAEMRSALTRIPAWPLVLPGAPTVLTAGSGSGSGSEGAGRDEVIAPSWEPGAGIHNMENIGLEPVWPYDLITDRSPLFGLARRTYFARPTKAHIDWSFDPVQAARLGLGDEVRATLIDITETNQKYINGFARWEGVGGEFYVEQTGVVALAVEEALVSDPDGVIRIAPAVPKGWDMDGSVSVRGQTRVDVEAKGGVVRAVGFEVGQTERLKVRNPWPGKPARVSGGAGGNGVAVQADGDGVLSFPVVAGHWYRLYPVDVGDGGFARVEGQRATEARRLGPEKKSVQIGLFPALEP